MQHGSSAVLERNMCMPVFFLQISFNLFKRLAKGTVKLSDKNRL